MQPLSQIHEKSYPLQDADDLDCILDRIGNARYVLLGEASHGTSEFFTWRSRLSRRLIVEKGFSFIAVEGDWPDCYNVNRFIKAHPGSGSSPDEVLQGFGRWPTWMWANREVAELVGWMRNHNDLVPESRKAGFYGLDVYSLWESMALVVDYLERIDPDAARAARGAYSCFEPYYDDVQEYARATALVPTSCEDETVAMLRELRRKAPEYEADGTEAFFVAEQNALVARNAELYYRTMVRGGPLSWNVRDNHMMETLERLMRHHGPDSRCIVWGHNSHIGDARFTDMAGAGMINLGQLARETHSEDDVILVGFGTHRGTVIAADEWGAPPRRMEVPPAREDSVEHLLHRSAVGNATFIFDGKRPMIPDLLPARCHRAIGVVYDPTRERWGNYVPTILPRRYDVFMYLDLTKAVSPLYVPAIVDAEVETFPTGM